MDAKPQRPLRALRVRDENAMPPSLAPNKTIHQRNKSTPALSSLLLNGAVKPAPKRTVFADVSNTVRPIQPAKDDMALSSKAAAVASKESILRPLQENIKPTNLLRPAQRPLSSAFAKTNISLGISSTTASSTKPTVVADVPKVEPFNGKIVTRRATNNFKDISIPVEEKVTIPIKDIRSNISTVPVHQSLPARRENLEPLLQESAPKHTHTYEQLSEVVQSVASIGVVAPVQENVEQLLPAIPEDLEAAIAEALQSDNVDIQREYPDILPSAIAVDKYDGVQLDATPDEKYEYLDALEQQARNLELEQDEEYVREQQVPLATEAVEYWDEEDEEEYYDVDGYTTARSIRSRGDNTTGGVTVVLAPRVTAKTQRELEAAKQYVESTKTQEDIEDETWDTSMVAEYGDEIFDYMKRLEDRMRPNPYYMDNQAEIQWSMRSVLMDWLVQVHHRFTLLPETLFLSVNYVDRFLSCKVVSLGKLQLVGATALFVAAKYEEINCPSVQEIVYMVDNGYTVDEILKAERFMLSMLAFELGWPGPMSFLRRISKADDYDLETRTLAKYFLEVTVMDERFVGCVPSFTAAGAHCLARLMLKKGDWSPAHVFYSGYTYSQLRNLVATILECCEDPQKHHLAVYEKYADKRFKRASQFVEMELQKGFRLPPTSRESSMGHSQSWRRR